MQAAGGDDIEDVDDMEAVDNVEEADESEKSQVTFLNILLPQLCSVKNVKKIIIKKKCYFLLHRTDQGGGLAVDVPYVERGSRTKI